MKPDIYKSQDSMEFWNANQHPPSLVAQHMLGLNILLPHIADVPFSWLLGLAEFIATISVTVNIFDTDNESSQTHKK